MPDESFFDEPCNDAINDLIGRLILLVAADDLDLTVLLIGGENGEILQDVQYHFWSQHAPGGCLQLCQAAGGVCLSVAPGSPEFKGHVDGAKSIRFSFCGKGKNIWY